LAATDAETLRSEAGLGYRAPYVVELAQAVAWGDLDLESLKADDIPTADVRKTLLAIKGVGAYAAANLLMILGTTTFCPSTPGHSSWSLTSGTAAIPWGRLRPRPPLRGGANGRAWPTGSGIGRTRVMRRKRDVVLAELVCLQHGILWVYLKL